MDFYYQVVKTPVTAHSTCSIFSLSSPSPEPRVNFGYEPEYPYNLDFDSLKLADGYAMGMRSAPLYPSTLEEREETPSKLREVTTPGFAKSNFNETHHGYENDAEEASIKAYRDEYHDEQPTSGSETNTSATTPSLTDTPITAATTYNSASLVDHDAITVPVEEKTVYQSPSPPPTPSPAPRLLEPPPKKSSACGSYEIYKNSLPFRQLGWASEGQTVTREITLPPRLVQVESPSPFPSPPPRLPPHRMAVREPLVPMLIYNENGEEEYVSRYNYLPTGRQARDPTPNALELLLAQARSSGFTTEAPRPRYRPSAASRDWYDSVVSERRPLSSARRRAREGLFAALSRRTESRPQYNNNIMPNPPFPWMRR
ncbi:hypothetical protein MaudCBS49596_004130 [Microsporum audouinii]